MGRPHRQETYSIRIPLPDAEQVLLHRLNPIFRACTGYGWNTEFVEILMLSCYLQGALDGQNPKVLEAVARGKA